MCKDAASLIGTKFSKRFADGSMFCAEDGSGEQRGVDGAGSADGKSANWDTTRHLRNGEERIEAFKGFGFDRDAKDRENRFRGGHAGKMSGAACARDNDFNASLFGGLCIFEEEVGSAVGGDNACFMWNMEFVERLGGEFHGVPVGAGAHDDADERFGRRWFVF